MNRNDVIKTIQEKLLLQHDVKSGRIYQDLLKQLAKLYLEIGNEEKAICYLIESHAVTLRLQSAFRMDQIIQKNLDSIESKPPLDKELIHFHNEEYNRDFTTRLQALPPEWTVMQVTSGFNQNVRFMNPKTVRQPPAIHITRLAPGFKPYCVTTALSHTENTDILLEQKNIVNEHKKEVMNLFKMKSLYWKSKQEKNIRLKSVVRHLETRWLKEWRSLFIGQLIDKELEESVRSKVDEIISCMVDKGDCKPLYEREKQMLYQVVLGVPNLSEFEVKRAVATIFSINIRSSPAKELANNICNLKMEFPQLSTAPRHPVILIIDDDLVTLPWEMISILQGHPVSRLPSLHLIHALYKAHEKDIVGGSKVNVDSNKAYYIINPEKNLNDMEERLRKAFIPRFPKWQGTFGVKPTSEEFSKALTNNDIFIYSGHGSGSVYLASQIIQKLCVNAVSFLFGCNSMGLSSFGSRVEMWSSAYSYIIGSSPCIIGTMWEVTDRDVDRLSTTLLHNWIPPTEEMKRRILKGEEKRKALNNDDFEFDLIKQTNKDWHQEPELLRVIPKGRLGALHFLTSAALISFGLPIKIQPQH